MALRRFLGHKPAVVAAVVLVLMVVFVLLAPITARYGVDEAVFETTAEQSNRYLSPRAEAWFGTDEIGRDLYSRLIYGTRVVARRSGSPRRSSPSSSAPRSVPSPGSAAAGSTTC